MSCSAVFLFLLLLLVLQNGRGSETIPEKTQNCPAFGDTIFDSGQCTVVLEHQVVDVNGTSNFCHKVIGLESFSHHPT